MIIVIVGRGSAPIYDLIAAIALSKLRVITHATIQRRHFVAGGGLGLTIAAIVRHAYRTPKTKSDARIGRAGRKSQANREKGRTAPRGANFRFIQARSRILGSP